MSNATLHPVNGKVSVFNGETLIASTSQALCTAQIEADGDILIASADVAPDAGPLTKPSSIAGTNGAGFVSFDRSKVRILIEDVWPDGGATTNAFPRWGDALDLARLMDVQPAGENRFIAPAYGTVRRNVVEGGQLMGNAIVAAAKTFPDKRVVSAHVVLSRPAVFEETLDLQVDVHRAGRQFATLDVQTTQKGKPVCSALLLMDSGAPHLIRGQAQMPDVPGPEESPFYDFGCVGRDVRFVHGHYSGDPDQVGPPELHSWVRHRDNPVELYMRQALLGQSTTHYTVAASMLPHKGFGEAVAHSTLSTGVVTVTLALHEDVDISEWLLYTNTSTYAGHGLAAGEGRVFTTDGHLVASFATQVMIRGFVGGERQIDPSRLM